MKYLSSKLISKELLSEVLGENVIIFEHSQFPHGDNGIRYRFNVNSGKIEWINIYELAHKCKEWAYDKDFMLVSGIHTRKNEQVWCEIYTHDDLNNTVTQFQEYTEPEAILKACEWIMKEIR